MGVGLNTTLNTAKVAMLVDQTAISVVGQNIANVNNPNFTRQELQIQAAFPIFTTPGAIGTGVRPTQVIRRFDEFLQKQILENQTHMDKLGVQNDAFLRTERIFNESDGFGINRAMSDFFNSFEDLAVTPDGGAERSNVIARARVLSQRANKINSDLKNLRVDLNTKITGGVDKINKLTAQIVEMNRMIHESETTLINANDFRDQRDALVKELSQFVDISSFEQSNNEIVVSTTSGRLLVAGQAAFQLKTIPNADDPVTSDVYWTDLSGNRVNITDELVGGQVGGAIQIRDNELLDYKDRLDHVFATLIREVNRIHAGGIGLDGSTGLNFFNGLRPSSTADSKNTGTGVIASATIIDPAAVSVDKYEILFASAGSFTVNNLTTGQTSGTFTFTAGSSIPFFLGKGIDVSISGAPAAGDKFVVNAARDASMLIGVNSQLISNNLKIAAGTTTHFSDGSNALSIAALATSRLIGQTVNAGSGAFTLSEFYNTLVGDIGTATSSSNSNLKQQEGIQNQLFNRREQVSGVALDEEMIKLIQFQHAFGASAKLITTVDELLQTMLNMT